MMPDLTYLSILEVPERIVDVSVAVKRVVDGRVYYDNGTWKAKEPREGIVALVVPVPGPREWSPRKGKPEFLKVGEVKAGDSLTITVNMEGNKSFKWMAGTAERAADVGIFDIPPGHRIDHIRITSGQLIIDNIRS